MTARTPYQIHTGQLSRVIALVNSVTATPTKTIVAILISVYHTPDLYESKVIIDCCNDIIKLCGVSNMVCGLRQFGDITSHNSTFGVYRLQSNE